jgi:hypothetical protein
MMNAVTLVGFLRSHAKDLTALSIGKPRAPVVSGEGGLTGLANGVRTFEAMPPELHDRPMRHSTNEGDYRPGV